MQIEVKTRRGFVNIGLVFLGTRIVIKRLNDLQCNAVGPVIQLTTQLIKQILKNTDL